MTLGFESPLNLIFARLFAQSGTAAAAWSGMWYGLAMGAMDAATRGVSQPAAAQPPEADEAAAVPPVALVRSARPAARRGATSRR
jgi:hypothetical protein